jgi:hypothetical protein
MAEVGEFLGGKHEVLSKTLVQPKKKFSLQQNNK